VEPLEPQAAHEDHEAHGDRLGREDHEAHEEASALAEAGVRPAVRGMLAVAG
jgi:hypothetical protein